MTDIIDKVQGPVIPLPVPFNELFEVDYKSLASYVDFLCSNGIKNVMTTVGTSRYNLISWDEAKLINETVVQAANGRAITIVANPTTGGTQAAVDFAKHSKSIGADFFLLFFPERHYGEENTYNFFEHVAQSSSIDILIHEMPLRNGLGPGQIQYSIDLLNRLIDIPNIQGVKEEALDAEYSNKVVESLSEKAIIIGAGGGMSRYLNRDFDLGAKAYLGGIGNFFPQLELDFFEAITDGDRAKAEKIVNEIEISYFQDVVPIGWHPSLKAALALKGLMPFHERPPMKEVSGEELELVRSSLLKNGWL